MSGTSPEATVGDPTRDAPGDGPPAGSGPGTTGGGVAPERVERSAFVEQLGGVRGLVDSGLPALVFVTVNILVGLQPAVVSAVACGVGVLVLRLARRETVQQAVSGFLGLALAAFIAARTGRAEGFFLPGIAMNFLYAGALLGSVALRRPLIGYAVAAFEGRGHSWRDDPRVRRVYATATLGWVAYFVVRAVAALALFNAESPVGLLVLRLSGFPMMLAAVALTVAYTRRATRALPAT